MSETPTCADLVKASGNVMGGYEARCFQEPMGCVADDRIDCENGCMLVLAYRAGKAERDAEIITLRAQLEEARAKAIEDAITALRGIHHYGEYGESGQYVIDVGCEALRALLHGSAK